jgi:hypothetical protein
MTGRFTSRREIALVACALLVPIPVLAASGLGVPLPSMVERGLASLLPLPGGQETSSPDSESGTAAATVGSTGGPATEGRAAVPDSEDAEFSSSAFSAAATPGASTETTVRGGGTTGSGDSEDEDRPAADDDPPAPAPEEPLPAPEPERLPAVETSTAAGTSEAPLLEVTTDEDGVTADVAVGDDGAGVSVDTGLGDGEAPDVDVTLPGSGIGIP